MDLELKNRVALVAASSKGLGKAVAWELAKEGAKLVICSRNKALLEKTADDIFLGTGVSVFPLAVDLAEPDQINWMINETMDLFGKVDILVTNSGGPAPGGFEEIDENEWAHAIQLTLMSAIRLIKAVLPGMKKQKWGRIINIASVSAKQSIDRLILSNVLRPGVVGLTKSLSQDLAQHNILVNAVCPGFIKTDRVMQLFENKSKNSDKSVNDLLQEKSAQIPLKRIGQPEELAHLIAFLASEKASYITGTSIQVDGGFVTGL